MSKSKVKSNPKRALAYIRVSTDKQEISPEVQTEQITAYCKMKGYNLGLEYRDDATAKTLERPNLKEALYAMSKGQAEVLVIAKLCRLTRSLGDLSALLERCEREGWTFVSVAEDFNTSSAMGRLVVNIIGSINQWEREVIAERTSVVLQHLKANGRRWTKDAPYGCHWKENGHNAKGDIIYKLEKNLVEQRTLQRIVTMRLTGHGQQAIASALNEKGWLNRAGRGWTRQRIFSILKQQAREEVAE